RILAIYTLFLHDALPIYFIQRLPGQYHERVSERGATFSAGQRQLLSFARTLAFDPTILILDEATANIDTETEQWIQEALEKLMTDRKSTRLNSNHVSNTY